MKTFLESPLWRENYINGIQPVAIASLDYERMEAIEVPTEESFLNSITERPATIELIEEISKTDDGKQYGIRVRWNENSDEKGE